MTLWRNGSISRNLALLLIMALVPVLALLLYTGFEQRRNAITTARQNVQLLTRSMAETQKDLAAASRQFLSTLALFPTVQSFDPEACRQLFTALVKQNPDYQNITLTDLDGQVVAAALPFASVNLADRKHVREALDQQSFAVGEFILSRVGTTVPAFAFGYPVTGNDGQLSGALTAAVSLTRFADFYDAARLPDQSFFAITDHQGMFLYSYPQRDSGRIGQPIQGSVRETTLATAAAGIYVGTEFDAIRRIIAFEPIRLTPEDPPYLYLWLGIPEADILRPANSILVRNLSILFAIVGLALFATWRFGRATLIAPITGLAEATRTFAGGTLEEQARHELAAREISTLTEAFYDMAATLESNRVRLLENEARFRLIMDSLDALVYVADMETYEILFINRYGKEIMGDITGCLCWQSLQKDQSGPCAFCTNHKLVDENGRPTGLYSWEFRNTQTEHWFYIHDRAIQWTDGRLVRLEIATDITEKKVAEMELALEKERLAVTLKSIGDGVITTDITGRVAMLNPIAEELTGWSTADAAGRPLEDIFVIINEETRKTCENPVAKVLATGQIIGLANHTALIARDGTERSIADSGAPILSTDKEIIGVVLVFRDITEQQVLEAEVHRAKKLESLGLLAGGIAHDFNNMLTAILGNIELSQRDRQLADTTRKRLDDAIKASLRARDLTRQLLTFAKGGQPIKQTASLPEVIKDSADFVLHGKAVGCRYHFSTDLHLVDIDKNQISQVVQNLILNAVQAMPQGGTIDVFCDNAKPAEIARLKLPAGSDFVKMQIRDQGEGIPPAVLDKIFDPYFSTKLKGHGLGLAIVHSIIGKHNGQIRVTSTPGDGTLFTIFLPATREHSANSGAGKIALSDKTKLRILIMDDEPPVLDATGQMLTDLGHETLQAVDGNEALQHYRDAMQQQHPIDLLIMDLTIPGGRGGKDTIQELLTLDPEARVIVASGYSHDPIMADFRESGFRAALPKPFSMQELSSAIESAMTNEETHLNHP